MLRWLRLPEGSERQWPKSKQNLDTWRSDLVGEAESGQPSTRRTSVDETHLEAGVKTMRSGYSRKKFPNHIYTKIREAHGEPWVRELPGLRLETWQGLPEDVNP